MKKFALLDPLRGLAALWVYTFHYQFGPWLDHDLPMVAALFRMGFLGVPFFFVISGYCIVGSARGSLERQESIGGFLKRRLRRIYPTFWISLVLAIGMPFWLAEVSRFKSGTFVMPAHTLNNGFLDYRLFDWFQTITLTRVFAHIPEAMNLQYKFTSLNSVYWTLALEVQFYFVVALAMLFGRRFYGAFLAVTLVGFASMLIPGVWLTGIFLPYWPMFALGALLYWLVERGHHLVMPETRIARYVLATVAVIGALTLAWYLSVYGEVNATLMAFFFSVWLMLAYPFDRIVRGWSEGQAHRYARVPLLLFFAFGSMSYSLYLVHTKLYPPASQIMGRVLTAGSVPFDISVVVLTCAGSFIFYYLAERPFARSPRKAQTGDVLVTPELTTT